MVPKDVVLRATLLLPSLDAAANQRVHLQLSLLYELPSLLHFEPCRQFLSESFILV